jgi:hypothetical protein
MNLVNKNLNQEIQIGYCLIDTNYDHMTEYTHLTIELFRHVKDQVLKLVSHQVPKIYKKETVPVDLKEDKKTKHFKDSK